MFGSGRRVALCLALSLLLASLVACTPRSASKPEVPEPPSHTEPEKPDEQPVDAETEPNDQDDYDRVEVYSPVSVPWLTVNPLEIKEEIRRQGTYQDMLVFISGLRDDDVLMAINDNLGELYVHLKERDLPPMRGIRLLVRAEAKPVVNSIQAQTYFSYNNVLSVVVTNFREYRIPGYSHSMNMAMTETRNFDLTTGHEITLRDVLTDDVDYLKVISDAISDQLLRSSIIDEHGNRLYAGPGFSAVSPFRGIRDDQVFYLTPAGITFVLDYRTPEFDTGFSRRGLQVSFEDLEGVVALTKRFEHPIGDLYISQEPPVYEFVHSPAGGVPRERFSREEHVDNVLVLAYFNYGVGIPDAVASFIQQQYEAHTFAEAKLKAIADSYWLLTHIVTSTRSGPFTTVNVYQRQHKSAKPFDIYEAQLLNTMGENMFDQSVTKTSYIYTFDAKGKKISLSSLFVPGFDYKLAIKAAYEKQVAHYHWIKLPSFSEGWDDMRFDPRVSGISFWTHSVSWGDHVSPVHFSLSYKDIGCENLTVFRIP